MEAYFILALLVSGFVGGVITQRRWGAAGSGFIAGILLGPAGWLVAAFMRGELLDCPYCKEWVKPAATVCPHCRHDLGPVVPIENIDRHEPPTAQKSTARAARMADPDIADYLAKKKERGN